MENTRQTAHLKFIEAYLRGLEKGDHEQVLPLFAPEAIQEEMPNLLYPNGQRRDVAALSRSAAKTRDVLTWHRYQVRHVVAQGDDVAVELEWTGELKVGFGSLPAGSTLRARIGMFLRIENGRIVWQRNYDCYDPF